ncbi:MAG: serine hydrolase [Algoriphagus sp.]|uniref:serine hydrolase domain-containing protein n=1 Tax=Algoriphagus sp. TaxID=1872435 RepID=UPI00262E2A0A|nr:serine hydrolase domain-containing protein [Algoriphagus sp.]MDG1276030.1 serine hydrolase [Algoriphagus sp.]
MKIGHTFISTLCLSILLFSCSTSEKEIKSELTPVQIFSSDYKAPVFKNDQRAEKIKTISSDLQELIASYSKANNIPGIAYGIVVDGELVISSAVGVLDINKQSPVTTSSEFRIASMTKSFTAMAILKLRDEGKLSLNDPVSKYIPEMENHRYLTKDSPIINIENLLTMTAGFPEDNPWGDRQLDETNQMLLDLISEGLTSSNVPSYTFEYSNTGYAMLGYIVSQVSGKSYQKYIKEEILNPLGMTHTYWEVDEVPSEQLAIGYRWEDEEWKLEPMLHDGSFGSMGGLITSIEDFSKYVSFHLSAWPPRNDEEAGPLKRSSLREMHSPQFPRLNTNATNYLGTPCPVVAGYGYGLGISQNCDGLKWVAHGGALPGFGSNYVFYPEYGIGIMAFCNLTYTTPWQLKEIEKLIFDKLELKPRELPVSSILEKRKDQIVETFQKGENALMAEIFAENFFLDESREHRIQGISKALSQAGQITSVTELVPQNQLRGTFRLKGENGDVAIFFTLTPEKDPKVQQLDFVFVEE